MKKKFLLKSIISLAVLVFFSSCQASNSETNSDTNNEKKEEMRKRVLIETDKGDIIIELYNETPVHRDNFLKLVEDGFYDGTLFHRVINQFMIQGGDPESVDAEAGQRLGTGGPGYTIEAEIIEGLIHKKGALAAARQGDQVNPERRSSGSQFYIVQGRVFSHEELDMIESRGGVKFTNEQRKIYTSLGGTPHLDNQYTVFGEVVEGLDVVEKIAEVETNQMDRPHSDISVKMSIIE